MLKHLIDDARSIIKR